MPVVNAETGTCVDEIARDIYRISTPFPPVGALAGGFSFNQVLIRAEQPLLFHTGPRQLFPVTLQAVRTVLDPATLRWIGLSHVEADECGALNEWLAVAPQAEPVCSLLAALVSVNDLADRPARGLKDGERLDLGDRQVRWLDAPHLPHGMECGYLFEEETRTLLCGDLFTQPGHDRPPLTDSAEAIWAPSEGMRQGFPYAPITTAGRILDRLAATEPAVLACMHGSSFRGDGAALLERLARTLDAEVRGGVAR